MPAADLGAPAHNVLTTREPATNAHWADQAHIPLTETDLRLLHDQGHDLHPEQAERRSQPTATSTRRNQENKP